MTTGFSKIEIILIKKNMCEDFTEADLLKVHKFIEMIRENDFIIVAREVVFYKNIDEIKLKFPLIKICAEGYVYNVKLEILEFYLKKYKKNYIQLDIL